MRSRAVIALGANQGEAVETLRRVVAELRTDPHMVLRGSSPVVQTVALTLHGYDPSAPRYANQVVVIDTDLDAPALLRSLQRLEAAHGRVRRERWGDRTLDLDLIDMTGVRVRTPWLTVPHPRAASRPFVLGPWLRADPRARLDGVPVSALLARAQAAGGAIG
jgi:2-amino-4-hydroxy-6-hydroxymethyldihydropteridine diphosphokinase